MRSVICGTFKTHDVRNPSASGHDQVQVTKNIPEPHSPLDHRGPTLGRVWRAVQHQGRQFSSLRHLRKRWLPWGPFLFWVFCWWESHGVNTSQRPLVDASDRCVPAWIAFRCALPASPAAGSALLLLHTPHGLNAGCNGSSCVCLNVKRADAYKWDRRKQSSAPISEYKVRLSHCQSYELIKSC